MDVGPIPWTAQIEWTRHHQLDREATMLVTYVIRYLESERAAEAAAKRALDAMQTNKGRR